MDRKELFEKNKGRIDLLFYNLQEILGKEFTRERFDKWVAQYDRDSRDYHNILHMLEMSEVGNLDGLTKKQQIYSIVTGFFHDEDYPGIVEEVRGTVSEEAINKYVSVLDGKKILKPLAENDEIGKMVYGIFGFKAGEELSPFAGMNEFYCAIAAAVELKSLNKDDEFIAAIVTGIEATVPFKGPERMEVLKERLIKTMPKLGLEQIDDIMISAVYTANKDVKAFMGGLENIAAEDGAIPTATVESVLVTNNGGDHISPEEVPELRGKNQGDYTAENFMAALLKRAGLYQLVLTGDDKNKSLPNLFHNVTLSNGMKYPSDAEIERCNKIAYENTKAARVATFARLISAGIVYAISQESENSKDIKLKDLLGPENRQTPDAKLPDDASEVRKTAFAALSNRDPGNYDIKKSPIAQMVMAKIDEEKITMLARAARDLLLPNKDKNNARDHKGFLKLISKDLSEVVAEAAINMKERAVAEKNFPLAEEIRRASIAAREIMNPSSNSFSF